MNMSIDSPAQSNGDAPSSAIEAAAAQAAQSTRLTNLAESLKLEHQFLRVPFEHYKKTIRINDRIAEKEVSVVLYSVLAAADRCDDMSSEEAVTHLTSLVSRLQGLKRKDLVDLDTFLEAKKIIYSLHNKEVAPALAWFSENRARLKKAKSKFEFQLRLQEFIELVRADNTILAIEYARKYFAPWGATHMKELQHVMATLAFRSNIVCDTYKVLFEAKQWDYLVEQFKQEFYRLFGMTLEPLLNIHLQAGLSTLKTPFCYEEDCPTDDPLSQEGFRKLAAQLPFSKQHHSKLVCYITKELMDSENPPLVLPNGCVQC